MKLNYHKIFSLLISAGLSLSMMGKNPIISEILRDNPTLTALWATQKADIDSESAENTLNGPEAEFEFLRGANGETKWSAGITQSFDWPGVYSARKKVNEMRQSAFVYLYNAKKLDIAVEANTLLIRYHYTMHRRDALTKLRDALKVISAALTTGLQMGSVTILDRMKARLELNSVERDIRIIDGTLAEIKTNLTELAGREIDWSMITPVIIPVLDPSVDKYLQTAVKWDPALNAAIITSVVSHQEAEVTRKSGLPSFAIGYRHEREEGVHFNGFAVSVSLPSWGINKRRLAAASAVTASLSEEDRVRATLSARIRSEWERASALKKDLDEANDLDFEEKYVKLLEEAYQAGELSVLDFVREVSYCSEVTLNLIDLHEEYTQLVASLNRYELL